jgi:hypothetical protein
MCFNDKASISTFIIGIVGSVALMKYGNPTFRKENIVSGIFLMFIAGIQLMDFFFWIDLKNKIGLNKITTIFGPLFNIGQPVILYLVKLLYFKPKNIFSLTNYNLPVFILNVLYFINLMIVYILFLSTSTLVTGTSNGHLKWPWIKYANPWAYLILLAINIFYLMNFNYALVLFLITYFFFILSVVYFSYNASELWCFFGAFIPIIMLFASYFINK